MENTLVSLLRSRYAGQKYVSIRFLEKYITAESVESHLTSKGIPISSKTLQSIIAKGLSLFAILILLEREHDVNEIFNSIQGDMLPFSNKETIPSVLGQSSDQISAFWDHQAKFPPKLTPQQNYLRELPGSIELPFTEKSKEQRGGSYGTVFRVKIDEGYIDGCGPNQALAWKRIYTKGHHPPWNKTIQEVKTLQARRHDHIVPLLACWMEPAVESYDKCLNLLFPWAEMDMKQWMNSSSAPPLLCGLDSLHLRKEFLYHTAQSLLCALSYIHREIDGFTASHHDIKPGNILLFGNQTWKICDFGKSGLKALQDGSETEGQDGLGTRAYQPPEYESSTGQRFGRAFDVWSMGCILIELTILLVYGWEIKELEAFTKQRTTKGEPFYKNMSVVTRWIEKLERHDDGSYNIISLLRTARDMLCIEREARVYSWEAYLDLYERLNLNATIDDRRKMTEKFVQGPRPGPFSSKENPRARTDAESNPIRDECLAKNDWPPVQCRISEVENFVKNDWPPVQCRISEVENFVKKFNSTPGRADVKELFTLIHKDDDQIRERQDLALKVAGALVPADITFSETVELFQKSRAWHFTETMEYRMNVIKILKGEVNVNQNGPGSMTPLCWAARHGNAVAAKLLLSQGGKINHRNDLGHTPLTIASIVGNASVVKVLIQYGDELEINPRGEKDRRTPLSHATQWAHVEVVKILLDHDADPQIQGIHGRTSISMAAACPKSEILDLFLSRENIDTSIKDKNGWSPLAHAKSELLSLQRQKNVSKDIIRGLKTNVEKLEEKEKLDITSGREGSRS